MPWVASSISFQSPPPMREATFQNLFQSVLSLISIPASHAGGDIDGARNTVGLTFQSPPPMREATFAHCIQAAHFEFQSPPPMREATATYCVAHYIFTRYSQIS